MGVDLTIVKGGKKKCLVFCCSNTSDQGTMMGALCAPCFEVITTGHVPKYGSTFIHKLAHLSPKRTRAACLAYVAEWACWKLRSSPNKQRYEAVRMQVEGSPQEHVTVLGAGTDSVAKKYEDIRLRACLLAAFESVGIEEVA